MRISAVFLISLATTGPAAASEDIRIALQASMQRHIDRSLVDGAILMVNMKSGALVETFPTKAHSVILRGDGYYVMCADIRDADGAKIPVDYYLVETDRGYRVFRVEVDNRAPLKALMRTGAVRRF